MPTVMYLMALAVTATQASSKAGLLGIEAEEVVVTAEEVKPGKPDDKPDADPQCKANEEVVSYPELADIYIAKAWVIELEEAYPGNPSQICVPKQQSQKCQQQNNANENGLRGQENGPKPCEIPACGGEKLLVYPPGHCCGLCVSKP